MIVTNLYWTIMLNFKKYFRHFIRNQNEFFYEGCYVEIKK